MSLADRLGMQDYHTLYDDAVNSTLKAHRPNPNQLVVGDEVREPLDKGRKHAKAVDKTWTFVVKAKKLPKLRIVLVDADGKPLAGRAWKLTAPKALSGKTKSDGLIEVPELPPQDKEGALEVIWQETKPSKAPAPAKDPEIKKPVYPRPIRASEFTDDQPAAPTATDDLMRFALKIGSLPSFNVDAGTRARLHNLGYECMPESGTATTKKSVQAYQRGRLKHMNPTGVTADIRAGLRDQHDNF